MYSLEFISFIVYIIYNLWIGLKNYQIDNRKVQVKNVPTYRNVFVHT